MRDIRNITISEFTKITNAVESVGKQLQSSISHTEQGVTSVIRDGIDQLESSFKRGLGDTERYLTASLDGNMDVLSSQLASLTEDQKNHTLSLQDNIDRALQLQRERILESFIQAQAKTSQIGSPMTLAKPRTAHTSWERSVRWEMSSEMPVQTILDSICKCPGMRQWRLKGKHQTGCIYAFNNRKKRTFSLSLKLQAFQRQITAMWEFEYSQLAWGRDWRINRNLTIRSTVPCNSPAFLAVKKLRSVVNETTTARELAEIFRDCLLQLQQIFANGEGWPTDIESNGRNLLHVRLYHAPFT